MSYTITPEMRLMDELDEFKIQLAAIGWLRIPDIIEACACLEKSWEMYVEGRLNPIVIHTGANLVMPRKVLNLPQMEQS